MRYRLIPKYFTYEIPTKNLPVNLKIERYESEIASLQKDLDEIKKEERNELNIYTMQTISSLISSRKNTIKCWKNGVFQPHSCKECKNLIKSNYNFYCIAKNNKKRNKNNIGNYWMCHLFQMRSN